MLATGQQNPAQIINSTIADNVFSDPNSEGKTAGLILERGSYAYLLNSIVYSEQFPIVTLGNYDIEGPAELTVSYSLIYEGQDSIDVNAESTLNWEFGNIIANPDFVDNSAGDYHLLSSSLSINGGHPDSVDNDGTRADIGVYAYLNSYTGPKWYVSESGNDLTATGASDDPFRSIQAALKLWK